HKDIDGFHSHNLARLNDEATDKIIPPVYSVIITMLQSINYDLTGKQVCLVANADIFENNLAGLLQHLGAKVTLAKATDNNLADQTKQADVLITAVGQPGYITADMIKDQAVIIDIGITKVNGEVKGDVDFASVKDKAGYLTPVPGGVGPLTIAMAFANTWQVFKQKRHDSS
ncbi:MAG: bifunctional methylenetetrahydrofolate dehydrogenase/methenyltetrahydrofolate cyclohydrolase, partial [bacterium]